MRDLYSPEEKAPASKFPWDNQHTQPLRLLAIEPATRIKPVR
jgi:hypothetical protein